MQLQDEYQYGLCVFVCVCVFSQWLSITHHIRRNNYDKKLSRRALP